MRNRPPLSRFLLALAGLIALAMPISASEGPIDLALYGRLLDVHTRAVGDLAGTRVDYRSLGSSKDWKRLARQVRAAEPSRLSEDGKLAFWINAYNILTIDLIVEHYPIESIKDIGSFFSPVWDRDVATIEGRSVSLGEIEHKILRKMGEPLIHGAIVCASASCPPLARIPFRSERIREDLAAAMRNWLESREKGFALDRKNRIVRLSKVFDWFEDDFESRGGVLGAISEFLEPGDRNWIRDRGRDASIRYFDYDWSLNDLE